MEIGLELILLGFSLPTSLDFAICASVIDFGSSYLCAYARNPEALPLLGSSGD